MQVNLPRQRLRLRVSAAAESALRSGHPWVWAESCREQSRAGQLGELAVIYDRQDRFLAIGLFDPHAPLRVRVLHTGKPQTIDPAWCKRTNGTRLTVLDLWRTLPADKFAEVADVLYLGSGR